MIDKELVQTLKDDRGKGVGGASFAAVIRGIARAQPPVFRRELAQDLKLSAATVSKAIANLKDVGLVTDGEHLTLGPGRPIVSLHWSGRYALLGIKIIDRGGLPAELAAVATTPGGELIGPLLRSSLRGKVQTDQALLIEHMAVLVNDLDKQCRTAGREPLGLGVTVGGHVQDGVVRVSYNTGWGAGDRAGHRKWEHRGSFTLAGQLEEATGLHAVAENDVTALAILDNLYNQHPVSTFAVVSVSHEGVGGGLILRGRPWRGHDGVAGEIGHVAANSAVLARQCRCGHWGCVEAHATPVAILADMQAKTLRDAARRPCEDESARDAFRRAGSALGHGVAPMLNWLNPGLVRLYFPADLQGSTDQASWFYLDGMRDVIRDRCFSTSKDVNFDVQFLAKDVFDERGARAAAALVLEQVVEDLEKNGHQ